MLRFFRSYTFTWVEIGIFKFAMLAIGLAIGAYWHEVFGEYLLAIVVFAVLTSAYTGFIALRQAAQAS